MKGIIVTPMSIKEVGRMNEVRAFIFRFRKPCWKCGHITDVLYATRPPTNEKKSEFNSDWFGDYEVTHDDEKEMGQAISNKFSWFGPGHSSTIGDQTYASWCNSCNSLQGNWYIKRDILQMLTNGEELEPTEYVDYETSFEPEDNM